jgi:hypothetical protein
MSCSQTTLGSWGYWKFRSNFSAKFLKMTESQHPQIIYCFYIHTQSLCRNYFPHVYISMDPTQLHSLWCSQTKTNSLFYFLTKVILSDINITLLHGDIIFAFTLCVWLCNKIYLQNYFLKVSWIWNVKNYFVSKLF